VSSICYQTIEVVNIGLQVFAIMILDGFLAHERLQGVHGIRERG
jgi:hypothetical protein